MEQKENLHGGKTIHRRRKAIMGFKNVKEEKWIQIHVCASELMAGSYQEKKNLLVLIREGA